MPRAPNRGLPALATAFVLAGLLGLSSTTSCKSQAATLCDLVCDCRHCSDLDRDLTCAGYGAQQDVANAYGCESQWENWASCFEDNGECNEETATFSTQGTGSCSGQRDLGIACTDNTQCTGPGQPTCQSGTCVARVCAGETNTGMMCMTNADCPIPGSVCRGTCFLQGGAFCQSDSDCPQIEDRCGEQAASLAQCQRDASSEDDA